LYYKVIENLRLGNELYEPDKNDRTKDKIRDTEYESFAILLKELFPSGAEVLSVNNRVYSIINQLTPFQIGRIVKIIQDDTSIQQMIGKLKKLFNNTSLREQKERAFTELEHHLDQDSSVKKIKEILKRFPENEKKYLEELLKKAS
jgi:hypothetical protein